MCRAAPVKTVIIDCAPIGFMDAVGVKTLQQVRDCTCVTSKPGPNIPLILPIIQELYSPTSAPLFKRKLPIILKKADKN